MQINDGKSTIAPVLPSTLPSTLLDDLGSLYHSYAFFGVQNQQLDGFYAGNQQTKEPIIKKNIAYTIEQCKKSAVPYVSFTELFCADAYFTMLARALGADICCAIDDNSKGFLTQAPVVAERLGLDNIQFIQGDVAELATLPAVDIVANLGGLYHIDNPEEILELSYAQAKQFLIIQNVVSLANSEPDYYECPASGWGWGWGNRYNPLSFDRLIRKLRYKVVAQHFNKLGANQRLEDKGSVYYLIAK